MIVTFCDLTLALTFAQYLHISLMVYPMDELICMQSLAAATHSRFSNIDDITLMATFDRPL